MKKCLELIISIPFLFVEFSCIGCGHILNFIQVILEKIKFCNIIKEYRKEYCYEI